MEPNSAYIVHKMIVTLKSGYSIRNKTNRTFLFISLSDPVSLYDKLGFPSGVIEHELYMNHVRESKLYLIVEYGWGENFEDVFVVWIGGDDSCVEVTEQVLDEVLFELHKNGVNMGLGIKNPA